MGEVKEHTDIEYFLDPLLLVNLSVWDDWESLKHYVYRSGHVQYIKRRKDWFQPFEGPHSVLWWLEDGHIPDLAEALRKLEKLRESGSSEEAFDLSFLSS